MMKKRRVRDTAPAQYFRPCWIHTSLCGCALEKLHFFRYGALIRPVFDTGLAQCRVQAIPSLLAGVWSSSAWTSSSLNANLSSHDLKLQLLMRAAYEHPSKGEKRMRKEGTVRIALFLLQLTWDIMWHSMDEMWVSVFTRVV